MRRNRWHVALLLAAATGAATGLVVAGFEFVTRNLILDHLLEAPLWVLAVAPAAGLALAALSLRYVAGGASPATSDEYIRNFHDATTELPVRPAPGKLLASMFTLGLGGALGFEGPSIYAGSAIGSAIQPRFERFFGRDQLKVLMVAGAAAGVAAIFKAPATGAVFALEVPFREDTAAKRMLLPALTGAAVGYLVFVVFAGTTPLFPVHDKVEFAARDLVGAIILGLLCGVGARGFAKTVGLAKRLSTMGHPAVRIAIAGAVLAAGVLISHAVTGHPLTFGAGYNVLEYLEDPSVSVPLLVFVFVARLIAIDATLAGGGAGGLFVPLVVLGAILGRMTHGAVGGSTTTLYTVVGVAAFLGAGYRTPLAGVMFVAETTGQPSFVVPGLLASVAAALVMGNASVSEYQLLARDSETDDHNPRLE